MPPAGAARVHWRPGAPRSNHRASPAPSLLAWARPGLCSGIVAGAYRDSGDVQGAAAVPAVPPSPSPPGPIGWAGLAPGPDSPAARRPSRRVGRSRRSAAMGAARSGELISSRGLCRSARPRPRLIRKADTGRPGAAARPGIRPEGRAIKGCCLDGAVLGSVCPLAATTPLHHSSDKRPDRPNRAQQPAARHAEAGTAGDDALCSDASVETNSKTLDSILSSHVVSLRGWSRYKFRDITKNSWLTMEKIFLIYPGVCPLYSFRDIPADSPCGGFRAAPPNFPSTFH